MNVVIKKLRAYPELDSRGNLALAGSLELSDGSRVNASIANHLSNKKELIFLDTHKAVTYLNELIGPKLVNISPLDFQKIDNWLDSIDQTPNKQVIGFNTTLLVSKLIYRSGALINKQPLYRYLNTIENS